MRAVELIIYLNLNELSKPYEVEGNKFDPG
jgi:hypothetical protein